MKSFKLDTTPKIKPGFAVPDGYFENFQAAMMQQLRPEPKVVALHQNRKSWWYAAAAVLVLALSIPILDNVTPAADSDLTAIDYYLAQNEISDEQIVELLTVEEISKIKIENDPDDAAIEEAFRSGIIDNIN